MLILSRRTNETIHIGDNITITVLSIKGNQVRLGIDAPREVEVHREEIYRRIHDHNKASCTPAGTTTFSACGGSGPSTSRHT